MALDINTNTNSLYAQSFLSAYSGSPSTQDQNPAELAISQSVQQDIAEDTQGVSNASQGVSLIQTATGALGQTLNILQQMSTLATEGASGTLSSSQLSDVQTEFGQLQTEVDNIAATTTFNGISLLQNPSGSIAIQVSGSSSVTVNLPQANTTALGIASANVSTASNAAAAMTSITNAINTISSGLAQLGSSQVSLQNASALDVGMTVNLASEDSFNNSSTSAQTTVLDQADIMILADSNAASADTLQLLPGYQNNSSVNGGSLVNIQA